MIKEWLKRHPKIRALTANFGLFGGAVEEFASQLAELPTSDLQQSVPTGQELPNFLVNAGAGLLRAGKLAKDGRREGDGDGEWRGYRNLEIEIRRITPGALSQMQG